MEATGVPGRAERPSGGFVPDFGDMAADRAPRRIAVAQPSRRTAPARNLYG
jgi:hypothetical protein